MKKRVICLLFIFIIILFNVSSYSRTEEFYELQFEIINNSENRNFDIYLLLSEEYITFAIENDDLEIKYTGVNTLKNNDIPSINLDKTKVQDDIYEENGIKYIQILLDKYKKDTYSFDILSDYTELNIKYRIKGKSEDYIVHIDNFKVEDDKCEVQYNVDQNIVKQPDKKVFSFYTIVLIIILIIVILLGSISYIEQKINKR